MKGIILARYEIQPSSFICTTERFWEAVVKRNSNQMQVADSRGVTYQIEIKDV